ncbi:oxidoreductase [Ascochyta rabiei]|uniref:aldehyde dehydrogenase (NAD(+)) n=1 Tax=Didymella rabiei TaxID=5454 RepID=A0A163DGG2_DIDRA|nr:oxidoreductase [Ascochyta rabiei]
MTDVVETQLLINNKLVPASDNGSFELLSPHTGELVAKVAEATLDDVNAAVDAAQAAFPAWSALSPAERGAPLKKLAQLHVSEKDELAQLDAISMGKPISTHAVDVNYAVTQYNYFAEAAYPQGRTSLNTPGFLNMSLRQPFGVVAVIIPWNAPLIFFSKKVAPALAAGNCVVVKSSEKAPLTSWKVSQWIEKCGFPPGVVNVLSGHGQTSGQALAEHMRVRALSFTGSTRTGRAIAIAAAKSNLKKVVFELGGKSPSLVFEDADIDQAAKELELSINSNSGQACFASSRIYVQDSVKDEFIKAFTRIASARKLGDPTSPATNHGPQADRTQFEAVQKYIALGKEDAGTTIDTSPSAPNNTGTSPHHIHPVIFTDVPETSRLTKEEIFGPVVVINTFATEADALAKANDTEFGLYASLYTRDLERALRVAKKLESGMLGVNCTSPTNCWDLPFGGWKGSGTGRESLLESMEHYLEVKSVYVRVGGIGGS